jgi:hypothetical protein
MGKLKSLVPDEHRNGVDVSYNAVEAGIMVGVSYVQNEQFRFQGFKRESVKRITVECEDMTYLIDFTKDGELQYVSLYNV